MKNLPGWLKRMAEENGWTEADMLRLALKFMAETDNTESFVNYLRFASEVPR